MSNIYSDKNKIKFTDISERYAIPKKYRAKQGEVHSALIHYVVKHFQNTKRYKQQVVDALNILTYSILENELPPFDWRTDDPFSNIPNLDMELVKDTVGVYYLDIDCIEWDVTPVDILPDVNDSNLSYSAKPERNLKTIPKSISKPKAKVYSSTSEKLTPKEDLYIQSPKYAQFDVSSPWLAMEDRGDNLVIYKSLPEVPTKQNEISITTDVNKLTEAELMRLYPNHLIRTRSASMYERHQGLDYDEDLGCIIPIRGFSKEQIVDNIIRYPHFYKLKRLNDGILTSFYEDIEIDGELLSISTVWDSLPESKIIPRQSDFIKEYVIRRYLLEEENGVDHKYKLYGRLDPFLTLFMPPERYIERGYTDTTEIVKQCVRSRVAFKQSRNPILKRLNINV